MIGIISGGAWALILIGIICVIAGFAKFKRKDEYELSSSVSDTWVFRIGVVLIVLGIITRIILAVI